MLNRKEYIREWRKLHPLSEEQKIHHREHNREYMKKYRQIHPNQSSRYYKNHPEKRKERDEHYYQTHKEEMEKHQKEGKQNLKFSVMAVYSEGQPKCACCGESELSFLSIDHINGGGNQHKKEIGKRGSSFYRWLLNQDFPEGFQVLCMNCQFGKKCNEGVCPHEELSMVKTTEGLYKTVISKIVTKK